LAGALGLLAGGAAAHLHLGRLLSGGTNLDLLRITALSAAGANLVNNLPALLVALPHTGTGIWALLLGVNVGPLVLVTGSLAALLWQASLKAMGVRVSGAQFGRVGVRVHDDKAATVFRIGGPSRLRRARTAAPHLISPSTPSTATTAASRGHRSGSSGPESRRCVWPAPKSGTIAITPTRWTTNPPSEFIPRAAIAAGRLLPAAWR